MGSKYFRPHFYLYYFVLNINTNTQMIEEKVHSLNFWTNSLKEHTEGACKIYYRLNGAWIHISTYSIAIKNNKEVSFSLVFGNIVPRVVYQRMARSFSDYLNIRFNRSILIYYDELE